MKIRKYIQKIIEQERCIGELQDEIEHLQAEVVEIDELRQSKVGRTQEKVNLFLQIHQLENDVRAWEEEVCELKGELV